MAITTPGDVGNPRKRRRKGGTNGGQQGGGTAPSSVSDQAAQGGTVGHIIQFFRARGLNDFAIAGILGNWRVESNFSTTSFNSGEGAHGLANWEGDRWPALEAFAQSKGTSPFDLQTQLEFTWHELTTGYSNVLQQLQGARSAYDAANIFNRQYEGSGDYTNNREQYAQTFLQDNFKGIANVQVNTKGNAGSSTGPSGGSLTSADLTSVQGLGHLFESVPELRKLVDEAQVKGWDLQTFENQVQNTTWWRTHSDTARSAIIEQANDPAQWARDTANLMGTINRLSQQTGLTITKAQRYAIAVNALMTGNQSDTAWLTNQISNVTNYGNIHSVAGFTGDMAGNIQQLQNMAASYGFKNWSPQDLARNARSIVDGTTTIDTFRQQLINSAKTAFPTFAKELDAGQTMDQIAQPYISTASSMLERDPSSFNVNSPLIMKGLQGVVSKPGEPPSSMPLWQFQNQIRQDPRWDLTNNAKAEAASTLTTLGQAWGFHV